MSPSERVKQAAARLRTAHETRHACAPVRDLLGPDDVAAAYAVQEESTLRRLALGRRLIGRKIGLTSKAVQQQLGVDQPDFGMLFDDMDVSAHEVVSFDLLMQPKIEAEIAIVLDKPLAHARHTIADIFGATAYAVAALEIVSSRIADWSIRLTDTIADNASSGCFVLGPQRARIADVDLVHCRMAMSLNGERVSTGTGAACMGNPLHAAVWLADTMVEAGRPLDAGDIILTGALGPMVAVSHGDIVEAEIEGVGRVRAAFARQ